MTNGENQRRLDRVWLRGRAVALLVAALLLAVDLALLLRVPVIGIANNGNFPRVMDTAGIHRVRGSAHEHWFVQPEFDSGPSHLEEHASSPALIAWAAKGLSSAFSVDADRMDLRQVGVAYWLLLLVAALPLVRAKFGALAGGVALLWVLSDPDYVLFFNSFHEDPALFVGAFGIAAWLLGHDGEAWSAWPRVARSAVFLFAFAALGAFSKEAYAPFGFFAGLAVLLASRNALAGSRRIWVPLATLGFVTFTAPAYFLWGGGLRFPEINRYNAVFDGVAVASTDARAALDAFHMAPAARSLVGTDYFSTGLSDGDRRSAAHISLGEIATFYVEHPTATSEALHRVGDALARAHATNFRQVGVDEDEGKGYYFARSVLHFGTMRPLLLGRPWKVWVWATACVGWLAASRVRRQWNAVPTTAAFLLALFVSQIVIAILGDGFFSLARHLIVARLSLDGAVMLALLALARALAERVGLARSNCAVDGSGAGGFDTVDELAEKARDDVRRFQRHQMPRVRNELEASTRDGECDLPASARGYRMVSSARVASAPRIRSLCRPGARRPLSAPERLLPALAAERDDVSVTPAIMASGHRTS